MARGGFGYLTIYLFLNGSLKWKHFIIHGYTWEKYINIPSEKYIYVHIYVYICVYTYLCKMDEYRSYAGLS